MMVEHLETYLLATGQITPLAARQARFLARLLARVLSRSVSDTGRAEDARFVFLLALAALEKGTPRADKKFLRAPLSRKSVDGCLDVLEKEETPLAVECAGAMKDPDTLEAIDAVLDALFRDPALFAPLSGPVPAAADEWPLLVVDENSGLAGFSRYYKAVSGLEKKLGVLLKAPLDKIKDETAAQEALASIFGPESILPGGKFHLRQAAATALALRARFLIVSGGPGTGKTSVVTQILRALVRIFPVQPDRIVLCAPTGRAKAHMGETVDREIAALEKRASVDSRDSGLNNLKRQTVHGLLGIRPDGSSKYDGRNPLPYEVIVVDEASMVDLCLFSRLIDAAAPGCRVILLGDMHQLPSVEAGAVLGDLTERFGAMDGYPTVTKETAGWIGKILEKVPVDEEGGDRDAMALCGDKTGKAGLLADHTVILTKKYRSSVRDGEDEIAGFSAQVNAGDSAAAMKLLRGCTTGTVKLIEGKDADSVVAWLEEHDADKIEQLKKLNGLDPDAAESQETLSAAFDVLDASRILTLVHGGPRGRFAINRQAEKLLRKKLGVDDRKTFFPGQPVIMTQNHHALDLFNGDTGVAVREKNGSLKAVFRRGGRYLGFAVDRLTGLEPAFAMTVHKAQGSEFGEVLLVLPDYETPLLFRQIIYTGITRARNRVVILGSEALLKRAIETAEVRPGGVSL